MKIAPIFDPAQQRKAPKPMQVDLQKAFLFGMTLWGCALVICICVWEITHISWFHNAMDICCYGLVLGVCMLIWEYFDRSDYRRLGE